VTADTIARMKKGSIVVDMAVESGGNVEGSVPDKEVDVNGVTILGYTNLAGRVAITRARCTQNNLANLVEHFWDKDAKAMALKREDEILKAAW
jgi:NAD(P) transhydrogenase subunit alpha